ncbi:dihydropteroate synthase [Motiliproteus sediminis]|uniref:dihydropteroate synthase n=1 Tax=Motiliproteus sediminis TaxID=1468178 RepID=UPI0031BA3D34
MSTFQLGRYALSTSQPQVMGILNVTPDSFSDGGQLLAGSAVSRGALLRRAEAMVQAGASILDIGGESTRPGAEPVSAQQELDRVVPAVEMIAAELDVAVSVDSSTPAVIRAAAAAGCDLINDVRALQRAGALSAAAESGLPVCLMHMQGQPGSMQQAPSYDDVVSEVAAFLRQRVSVCEAAGIERQRLLLDPGFGFGKTLQHNLQLLNRLGQLRQLGLPLLIGVSRKSMVGAVTGRSLEQRLVGSVAAAQMALQQGAWILRVHDVDATMDMVRLCRAVWSEGDDVDG